MLVSGLQTEICETVYCLIVDLSLLMSYKSIVLQFLQNLLKMTSSIFLSLVVLADFNDFGLILQDFEWPFR